MSITGIGALVALVGALLWLFTGAGPLIFGIGVIVALVGLAVGR